MITSSPQRGSIIVYALLTMSIMLVIGLSLESLFLRKFHRTTSARDSVMALYAADTGVEMCLNEARTLSRNAGAHDDLITTTTGTLPSGATFVIKGSGGSIPRTTTITGDCHGLGSHSLEFRVTGTYHGVQRTLEISQ